MKKSIGAKTLVYPTPVFVVGSYERSGRPNIMTAAWGICCSKPPCVAVSLRTSRYSYDNIANRKAFSIGKNIKDPSGEKSYQPNWKSSDLFGEPVGLKLLPA